MNGDSSNMLLTVVVNGVTIFSTSRVFSVELLTVVKTSH